MRAMKALCVTVLFGGTLVASGCSAIHDFGQYMFADDASTVLDAGTDAPRTPRGPTVVVHTAGGAIINTREYQLRISVGAPQPMGHRSNADHELHAGPVR